MTCRLPSALPRIGVLLGALAMPALAAAQTDPGRPLDLGNTNAGIDNATPTKAPEAWGCIQFSLAPDPVVPAAIPDRPLMTFAPKKGTVDGISKEPDFGFAGLIRHMFDPDAGICWGCWGTINSTYRNVEAAREGAALAKYVQQVLGLGSDVEDNGVPLTTPTAGVQLAEAPPSLRPARVPVPALYRLGVTARRTLAGSLLFAIHPLLALAPTADFLDAPSDHPQPVAGEDVLGAMPPSEEVLHFAGHYWGEAVGYRFQGPTWYDWFVDHVARRHLPPAQPEPEVELAQFAVAEDSAEPSEPAGEQLRVKPKEEKSAESPITCPYLLQQAADRHVRLMADPQVTQDVLSNLRSLEDADRLFELAGDLMREGHICEALTCYDVIRRMVPGSRFDAQVDEALAAFGDGVSAEAAEEQEAAPQTEGNLVPCVKQVLGLLQALGVPMSPLIKVYPCNKCSPQQLQDSEDLRHIECEWEGMWYADQPPTPGRAEPASADAGASAEKASSLDAHLRRPVSIHLNDMPLKTVLKDLRAFHGLKIRLDRKAIAEEGTDLEQPISVFLEDVSLRSALHLMLHPANLTFVVKDDSLWVTPRTKTKKAEPVIETVVPAGDDDGKTKSARQREREICRRLRTPVTLNFTDASLKTVIEDLRAFQGMNIVVDEPALAEHGISLGQAVSIKVDQISLKSALTLLLKPLHLTCVIKDEVLQITTEDHARGKQKTSTYDVSDLVVPRPRTTCSTEASEEEKLMRLITSTIAPRSWEAKGGSGTVDYFPLTHSLVILQTPDVQDQVADLLDALRRRLEQEKAGIAEQVSGLLKACRLAAEAGDTSHAADLARQAAALDPERVAADPLVYKLHLLEAVQTTPASPATKCQPRSGLECPRASDDPEVLPPPTEEAEPPQALRPVLPAVDPNVAAALDALLPEAGKDSVQQEDHSPPCDGEHKQADAAAEGESLLDLLLGGHGTTEVAIDLLDGSLRAACDVRCGGTVYHVRFSYGCFGMWTTPNTSGTPGDGEPR